MNHAAKFVSMFLGGIAVFTGFAFYYYTAYANPSRVQAPVSCSTQGTSATSLATTSVTYLAVTATTTITCDVMLAGDATQVWDSAILAVQHHASSSALSGIQWYYEFSNDRQDWYPESVYTNTNATTTYTNGADKVYRFLQSASSTLSGIGNGLATSSRAMKAIEVPVHTRYIRVNFTVQPGAPNSAVWAQLVGKTERIN